MSPHSTFAADQLNEMIGAVRAEKAKVNIQCKQTMVNSNNEKAQRLVKRLQECDANIASLLSQAADCLQVFVTTSASSSNQEGVHQEIENDESERVAKFEARAQEWYATLHDVQIGLRSAARNLRKVQQPPLAMQASNQGKSSSTSNGSTSSTFSTNQTRLGSATKGHSLAIAFSGTSTPVNMSRKGSDDSLETVKANKKASKSSDDLLLSSSNGSDEKHQLPSRRSLLGEFCDVEKGAGYMQMQERECDEESKLSLSALRQQEKGWRQLADALSSVALERKKSKGNDDQSNEDVEMTIPSKSDLFQSKLNSAFPNSSDQRLMNALLHLYMEVLPETSITPINGHNSDSTGKA